MTEFKTFYEVNEVSRWKGDGAGDSRMWGFAATCCLMVGSALFKPDAEQSRFKAYTLNSQEPEVTMNLKD